jgi:hypothetical protein
MDYQYQPKTTRRNYAAWANIILRSELDSKFIVNNNNSHIFDVRWFGSAVGLNIIVHKSRNICQGRTDCPIEYQYVMEVSLCDNMDFIYNKKAGYASSKFFDNIDELVVEINRIHKYAGGKPHRFPPIYPADFYVNPTPPVAHVLDYTQCTLST